MKQDSVIALEKILHVKFNTYYKNEFKGPERRSFYTKHLKCRFIMLQSHLIVSTMKLATGVTLPTYT